MLKNKSFWAVLGGVLIVSLLAACASGPPKRPTLKDANAPDWVIKGGGAFEDSNGRAFYGVGSAGGIKNHSLQRMAADDRARADLAKVFEFYTKYLSKNYLASTTAGDFEASSEEQHVEAAIKTVTSATLNGVSIINHWEHPYRNELYSLARLDLEKFKQNLDSYKQLSKEIRDAVKERAEKLHEELELEVLKKEGKF